MNITELIVELLQNGQKVELPGIGTFDSVLQEPHHDPATRTYYPATREIVFREGAGDDNAIVKIIAERECVGEGVASQMWTNYLDALTDKIDRTGQHQFGTLGTLSREGDGFGFRMAEGVIIEAGGSMETPLPEVKTYEHNDGYDPFAQFEMEEPVVTVVKKPEPTPIPEPEPEPTPQPEPPAETVKEEVGETMDKEWQDDLKRIEELPKTKADLKAEAKAEKERIKAEAKAEKQREKMRRLAQRDHNDTERRMEEERAAAARHEAEEKRRAEEEMRNAELKADEDRRQAEKDAEAAMVRAEKKAEEERIKTEKRAAALATLAASQAAQGKPVEEVLSSATEKELDKIQKEAERKAKEAEKEAARQAKEAEKEAARKLKEEKLQAEEEAKAAARQAKEAEKEAARQAKAAKKEAAKAAALAKADTGREKEEKKKGKGWLWLLLLLLLLLLLGGAAYYFLKVNPMHNVAHTEISGGNTHFDASNVNSLTFNTDMIDYSGREINRNTDQVCRDMSDYINNYLADQGYTNARPQVMDRVRQYADGRLNELLGNRFAVQRFIPYDDYVYRNAEPWLKSRHADKSRGTVQGELMDAGYLDRLLNQVVDEFGLTPDNAQTATAPAPQPQPQATPPAAPKKTVQQSNEAPSYVYVEKNSKQGFDIVAGFYVNKSTAARMTARLHELGCDAYIIEKNEMYYVSMGSAPTRTKAEALYQHIKSWYDGDIVIKEL